MSGGGGRMIEPERFPNKIGCGLAGCSFSTTVGLCHSSSGFWTRVEITHREDGTHAVLVDGALDDGDTA